jgi:hypothetical protein
LQSKVSGAESKASLIAAKLLPTVLQRDAL